MALALAATLMCLPGASLAEDAAATDAPAAIEETTTTVAEDPNEVLATVNGVEITRARFNTFYQSMLSYYGQYYDTTNESLQAAIRQSALEAAVQYQLIEAGGAGAVADRRRNRRRGSGSADQLGCCRAEWHGVHGHHR